MNKIRRETNGVIGNKKSEIFPSYGDVISFDWLEKIVRNFAVDELEKNRKEQNVDLEVFRGYCSLRGFECFEFVCLGKFSYEEEKLSYKALQNFVCLEGKAKFSNVVLKFRMVANGKRLCINGLNFVCFDQKKEFLNSAPKFSNVWQTQQLTEVSNA